MTDQDIKIELKDLFESMSKILGKGEKLSPTELKILLDTEAKKRECCIFLYHVWAIAELCCAYPEWSEANLSAICFPDIEKKLFRELLRDIFVCLEQTQFPVLEYNAIFDPGVDIRILLMDVLKRVELAQSLKLGVSLYTLDGFKGNILKANP